jgi:hypothetical protein
MTITIKKFQNNVGNFRKPQILYIIYCEALGLTPRPLGRKLSLVLPSFSQKRPKYPVCLQRGFFISILLSTQLSLAYFGDFNSFGSFDLLFGAA